MITSHTLERYLYLKEAISVLNEELTEIKQELLESGGMVTPDYIALVKDRERRQLAGIPIFEKKFGKLWLENNSLIYLVQYRQLEVYKTKAVSKNITSIQPSI